MFNENIMKFMSYLWIGLLLILITGFISVILLSKIYPTKYQSLKFIFNMSVRILKGMIKNKLGARSVKNSQYVKISYSGSLSGPQNNIYIPYSSKWRNKMIGWQVYLVDKDNVRKEITQQLGLPYLCSASMLGGKQIVFEKDSKNVCFGPHQIPVYPPELK